MFLIFDTETTGLPKKWNAPLTDFDNWPRMVQIAWQIHDINGELIKVENYIVKPENYNIPFNATKIHGISTELANEKGVSLLEVLSKFVDDVNNSSFIIGHNISFDNNIVGCELLRKNLENILVNCACIDTKEESTNYCKIPGSRKGKYKWPTLTELYYKLFNDEFDEAHNAAADVEATARCFLELIRKEVIPFSKVGFNQSDFTHFKKINNKPFELIGLNVKPYLDDETTSSDLSPKNDSIAKISIDSPFSHLRNHSQHSILQSTLSINSLVDNAVNEKMPAVGLTDHTNMYGVFNFIEKIISHPINKNKEYSDFKLKPIIGCELNLCANHLDKSKQDNGSQIPFLCKNKIGFYNLSKLSSKGFLDGFYYVPRIDKELLLNYKDGLIALTGGLYGLIPQLILNVGESQAEEEFKWWVENFGDDFYVEINRHNLEEEAYINKVLLDFADKYNVQIIASNNVYYLTKEDAKAHDILLCVKDGEKLSTPIGKGRNFRYGFPNEEFYFKSQNQMKEIFSDIPQAIYNINKLISKIEIFDLKREVLLPNFEIPRNFIDDLENNDKKSPENLYLRHLTYIGAKERYNEITDEIKERIEFELQVIKDSGYPGYFLIVQDFIAQARKMNVSVGPGRGSAAGSVVAYCIKITNVDPIKYDLLFERFLNPERISLPDIDIDFDDEGRNRVIDWVVDKYGKDKVAQIITYGTMAAKSSIRDTARVLDLPLIEADKTAKLIPNMTSLEKIFNKEEKELKKDFRNDDLNNVNKLLALSKQKNLTGETIMYARKLEGSIRNVGTHACGVIITPKPLIDLIPMSHSKDSELMVTQFDNNVVEKTGLLKMDFLGLRNLTIIKDCIKIINKLHLKEIDIENIPLDDIKTFEIFQNAETTGIFQFSSDGMKSHLKNLKPDNFNDLIAMNALYRPGPMEYIPNYIKRKHGNEVIEYDLPEMEEYLSSTYGITVYQEQVMLLSQKLAGFSKGDADMLRKGMGKKIKSVLDNLKPKFIKGCEERGFATNIIEKIWKDWEAFASYAFNKSHSTCYALIAYQTAYLKAHFPAELMASILTNHMRDIKDVTHFMEECKRMNISVLGPDVNESYYKFSVNKNGEIRFGLGAVKGVGEAAVNAIVDERKENSTFTSFEDFIKRVDLRAANKRTLESIVCAGGFDSFKIKRSQYFGIDNNSLSYIEKMIRFGNKIKDTINSNQYDIFGDSVEDNILSPDPPEVEPWNTMNLLSKEREVVGIYISGHPLDDYSFEIKNLCNTDLSFLSDINSIKGKELRFASVVTNFEHKITKNNKPYGVLHLEDYVNSHAFYLFGDDYLNFKKYFVIGWQIQVIGRVSKKFYNEELEFKFSSINLLSELIDKEVRDVFIKIDISNLNDEIVNNLVEIVSKNKGKHSLFLNVIDTPNMYNINLLSRKLKVNLEKSFISDIMKLNHVKLEIRS